MVEVDQEQVALVLSGVSRHRKPTLEDRLIARALAPWLDGELARGLQASLSEAHTARAEQLAGRRARRKVARQLDKLVDCAQDQRPGSRIALPPPSQEQVREVMPLILAIRSRLLCEQPLSAQGIARLKTLLCDRRSACYAPIGPDSLAVALEEIAELLQVEAPKPT